MKSVYLIADISQNPDHLQESLKSVLPYSEIFAVQLWGNRYDKKFIEEISDLCRHHKVPVLINQNWRLAEELNLSGVHFDEHPVDFGEFRSVNSQMMLGFTTGNDLEKIRQAEELGADYISFCSLFPSVTANSCEFVNFETITESRQMFSGQIFLAGGISPENISKLKVVPYNGIAVASGILGAQHPEEALKQYLTLLNS